MQREQGSRPLTGAVQGRTPPRQNDLLLCSVRRGNGCKTGKGGLFTNGVETSAVNKQLSGFRTPSWPRVCGGEAPAPPCSSAAVPSTAVHAASAVHAAALREERFIIQTRSGAGVHVHHRWGRPCCQVSASVIPQKFWSVWLKRLLLSSDPHEFQHLLQKS